MKKVSIPNNIIEKIIKDNNPTPFYIYDEIGIRNNLLRMQKAFSWNKNFKEFFAVKALPNPHIMNIFKNNGCGMDCSSMAELLLCEKLEIKGENIMFTSNTTPTREYVKAIELGATINIDSHTHIKQLICKRYIMN